MFLPVEVSSNPITITSSAFESGGLFMGDRVYMPEAEVHIVLDPFGTKTFELTSTFNFISETNQTSLTAFAYPQEWDLESTKNPSCEFEIICQQEEIHFVKLSFDQVIAMYNDTSGDVNSTDITDWGWIKDHNFATFNLTFIENTPKLLEVSVVSSVDFEGASGYMTYCGFSYCVGSAYSWEGMTHEIITMEVKGIENKTERFGDDVHEWVFNGFTPETGLSESWNQTWAKAVWDLTLSGDNFEITHVGCYGIYTVSWDPMAYHIEYYALIIVPIGVITGGIYFAKRRFGNQNK